MKNKKTLIDEQKINADKHSDGDAITMLDNVMRHSGYDAMLDLLKRMPRFQKSILSDSFNLNGCKNINHELANELRIIIEKENLNKLIKKPHKEKTQKRL
ncbi:hypothetical protein EO763_05145 [Pectobacterium odoriferum]|uniref:hypothetical protein n=1 Tax=Pectobacterium odoriferum TaxID=78398 RepID=UPI0013741D3D|nr:hypothetical protein [Pectobacterium odoriferum]QHP79375.1 hypothetical protein EO763_05145 [Pectobacterium odoriferum]